MNIVQLNNLTSNIASGSRKMFEILYVTVVPLLQKNTFLKEFNSNLAFKVSLSSQKCSRCLKTSKSKVIANPLPKAFPIAFLLVATAAIVSYPFYELT